MPDAPNNPQMLSPAQRRQWSEYWARHLEHKRTILRIVCDGDGPDGDGCDAEIEATKLDARAQGWRASWRRVPGTGVDLQVDLCPRCSKDRTARRCLGAVELEAVMLEEARRA